MAMDWVEGDSLRTIIKEARRRRAIPAEIAVKIIADAAAGLHAAHELRDLKGEPLELVHQDVTPGNVIVLYGGQVKLVDFGVAKVSTTVDVGLVKGKAGYLAPELFDGAAADRRSDVFALGVVLWEALTLRRLFGARTEEETFSRIRTLPVEAPSRQALAVTRDLDEVCLRALARDPAARYQTARAMHDDLLAVLRGANWSPDSEPIARFMRTSFATQIAARREVLRDLAALEDPRPEAIERMSAPEDEIAAGTPPGGDALVSGSHGAVPRPLSSAEVAGGEAADGDGEVMELSDGAVQLIDPAGKRRRRVMIAVGVAVAAVLVVLAITMGGGTRKRAEAGLAAGAEPPPVVALVVVDAGVVEVEPAVEPAPEIDAGVAVTDVREAQDVREPKRDRDRDRDRERDEPGPASARSLYKDGLGKYVAGDTGGAISRFQAAIVRDPRYAPAHRGLGMAYERKGERSRAARSFRTYLALAPSASDAGQIRARLAKL
jgi:serine/threonine-protein kinase